MATDLPLDHPDTGVVSPVIQTAHEGAIGVVHYGLGPIGRLVASLVARRPGLRSVAAVDVSDDLQGKSLTDLIGSSLGDAIKVSHTLNGVVDAHVALHCTTSSLQRVTPQLVELIDHGLNVISTTEELSFPWRENSILASRIDELARARGVTVLGTGINPGFAMEYLPIALSGASQEVTSVLVYRVQDAATRRVPLQRKVGAGLDVGEFSKRVKTGQLGHVGLRESVQAIAAALGWELSEITENIEPVIVQSDTAMSEGTILAGQVSGVHQRAQGYVNGSVRIDLTLQMAVGVGPSSDHIKLEGVPELTFDVPAGLHGDTCTAAVVVNSIPGVLRGEPGLRVMSELPPPSPWARPFVPAEWSFRER